MNSGNLFLILIFALELGVVPEIIDYQQLNSEQLQMVWFLGSNAMQGLCILVVKLSDRADAMARLFAEVIYCLGTCLSTNP